MKKPKRNLRERLSQKLSSLKEADKKIFLPLYIKTIARLFLIYHFTNVAIICLFLIEYYQGIKKELQRATPPLSHNQQY